MKTRKTLLIVSMIFIALYGLMASGCSTDPIKATKNNPERMEILMNHITNEDAFREKMIEKLMAKGDRQKFAEKLVTDEDFSRMVLSKILESPKGEEDVVSRIANRKEYITKVVEKALQMPEFKEAIIDALLANPEMVEYMKQSEKLKTALSDNPAVKK